MVNILSKSVRKLRIFLYENISRTVDKWCVKRMLFIATRNTLSIDLSKLRILAAENFSWYCKSLFKVMDAQSVILNS